MEKILKIPYNAFNDWDQLQTFLECRGNPDYILCGYVNLGFSDTIFDLGNLIHVDGDLNLGFSSIMSLGKLGSISGYLTLNLTSIRSLDNLKIVGGDLDLVDTPIKSLDTLEHVGGNLWLSTNDNIPKQELTRFNVKYVK